MTTRRRLPAALGVCLVALSGPALSQQPEKVWRVGFLSSRVRPENPESDYHIGLPRGLRELGYIEGKNLVIEWRFADGFYERLPELAAELVRLGVDVIVAADGTPSTIAAQNETATIPIVFTTAGDPVGSGLIKTLARPGGNTTGVSLLAGDSALKQMEMLLRIVPKRSRVGVLLNPANPYSTLALKRLRPAVEAGELALLSVEARTEPEIGSAFLLLTRKRAGAFIWINDAFLNQQRSQIAELAARHRLPSVGGLREYPEAGGLMSYGQNRAYNYHRAATYVDKILKRANPGELPVEQPTKLELVINRGVAKALGVTIPPDLLLLADRVIE